MTALCVPQPFMQTLRHRVLRDGYNTTAYQILNPGLRYWRAANDNAVAGYVRRGHTWVVAGVPVTPYDSLAAATSELQADAAADRCAVCYFGAESRLLELLKTSPDHSALVIGAQPVWDPRQWATKITGHASMREQLRRARSKSVRVDRELAPQRVRDDPRLQTCLSRWLMTRPMPPLHFLTEPAVLDGELADRRLYVAWRGTLVVGFLIASPIPVRDGWLLEQIVRDPAAPNGTTELLIDAAMRDLANDHAPYATLGMVALSDYSSLRQNPRWVRTLFGWVRAHGRRFYHFDGLQRYREKLRPDAWEPLYAIANRPRFPVRMLRDVAAAFCDGSLTGHLSRALIRAVWQETRWAGAAVLHRPRA